MSDPTENYIPPTVCYWVCNNPTCTEDGVQKGCTELGWVGVVCGVCQQPCTELPLEEPAAMTMRRRHDRHRHPRRAARHADR